MKLSHHLGSDRCPSGFLSYKSLAKSYREAKMVTYFISKGDQEEFLISLRCKVAEDSSSAGKAWAQVM